MPIECDQSGEPVLSQAEGPPGAAEAPGGARDVPDTLIEAGSGWRAVDFRELWRFRELIFILAWRDVMVRYKQTLLGAAWAVLQPALLTLVFTAFLGQIAASPSGKVPYPLYVYLGLLPWSFFASALNSVGNSVVNSEQLITKVYFPRLAIPVAAVGALLVDFVIAFVFLLLLLACYGITPSWGIVLVPALVALLTLASLGVGTLLAALNVTYRDVRHAIPFLVQLWMFATPVIYIQAGVGGGDGPSAAPAFGVLGALAEANPMTGLVSFFRAAVLGRELGGELPWLRLGYSAAVSAALLVAGCYYFRRVEDSFADVI
jgi:lipopolysaccharide transport system permease protein